MNFRFCPVLWLSVLASFAGCQKVESPVVVVPSEEIVSTESSTDSAAKTSLGSAKEMPTSTTADHGFKFEVDDNCGIDFTYYGSPSPELYMTEQNGGGVALLDVDHDGLIDVFLANGSHFKRPASSETQTHQLYRNATRSLDSLQFKDVTVAAGLATTGFGMGCAAADFTNDGFTDLLLCEYGRVRIWQNMGDGTWIETTIASGVSNNLWATSAAWADLDEDGDLDLYITNYVEYSPDDPPCYTQHVPPVQISCGPVGRTAQPDALWENKADGTFVDVSQSSGIRSGQDGKGLAVEIVDFDGDQLLDIYVSNDTTPNFLWTNSSNQSGMKFEDQGLATGSALGADGSASSSMGTACADFDGNGRFDLFVTNFENSVNDYYSNHSPGVFLHQSSLAGLDTASRPMLAFGTVSADFDLDQWPDLFVANGHIWDLRSLGFGHEYEMTPQLFRNRNGKRFLDVSSTSGEYFQQKWLGRAVAVGDLDNDGDADLAVSNLIKKSTVVINHSERHGQGMRLHVIGKTSARQPAGVRVTYRIKDRVQYCHLPAGGSFAATHDSRFLLSVGDAKAIDELTVYWQSGSVQSWMNLPVSPELTVIEGYRNGIVAE